MAQAFKCDRCSNLSEGVPAANLIDDKRGRRLSLCDNCENEVITNEFPYIIKEEEQAAADKKAKEDEAARIQAEKDAQVIPAETPPATEGGEVA